MGLVQLGRARLSLVLPRHRELLRMTKNHQLYDLFEAYARESMTLDSLLRELPRREKQVSKHQQICLDLQAEVVTLLTRLTEPLKPGAL
ncbi:hypothetical protein LAC81_22555 [Ensifer adhaerens]|nr:hypothetical protein LAC78_27235 [Ensifer adhaerens]UAY03466.1 hypothetical protein LAC80_33075 [Ensifer adhaerens]UAY11450.1 hypothetical protein LAC81_22555 [Ensifer adhaerens]